MEHLDALVLIALHDFARADAPADAGSLGRVLRRSATECAAALVRLDARGCCDASRARLTMKGLVAAASLRAHAQPRRLDNAATAWPCIERSV